MSCPQPELLGRFVDDRLDEAERVAIEEHVDDCDECRSTVAMLAKSAGELPTAASPPDGIAETVVDRRTARPSLAGWRPPGAKLDRYVLGEMLGRGGMGIVYEAHDPELDRKVAIKLLRPEFARKDPDAARRIAHEARVMARISHPNVVAVHDVGSVDDQVFVAMELVAAGSLKAWLAREPRTLAEILSVFVAAGQGLIAAHDAGVVHRDFKPDNVLVGDDGRVRVTDFGLAHDYVASTTSPEIAGTPAYMSPEQFEGGSVDARSDQFSFCAALYEALYRQRAFKGGNFAELGDAITHGRIEPAPAASGVPPSLRAILLRGLSRAPGDRFPTLADLLKALGRDRARRPRQIAIAAAIALVGVGIVFGADLIVRDRMRAVTRESFASTRAQLDKLIAMRTDTFAAQSDALLSLPALREVTATHDQSDFGLGDPASDRAHLETLHETLASASWVRLARTRPGDQLAIADAKGRLLYNSAAPAAWGNVIATIPAIAAVYGASSDTSLGVVRADDPIVARTELLPAGARSRLYVMFARVAVENGQPRAAFVQMVPSASLLAEVATEGQLSVMAPDGAIEGEVSERLARSASGEGIHEVSDGDATWLVQRAPLGESATRHGVAQIVLARRGDAGLAGLFPHARLVLALIAAALVSIVIGGIVVARRLDLTARRRA